MCVYVLYICMYYINTYKKYTIYIINNQKYLILTIIILSYDIIILYKLLCNLLKILSLDSLYFGNCNHISHNH
jgi:hypothetical protein